MEKEKEKEENVKKVAPHEYDVSATSSLIDILPREREEGLKKLLDEYSKKWGVTPEKAKEMLQNNYIGRKLLEEAGQRLWWNCKLY